jgi:NitT/TauT family transport system substrate-binding protein
MIRLPLRTLAVSAFIALSCAPPAARADDTLHVVGANPGGIEVLENVAEHAGLYKAEHLIVDKQYAGSASGCAQIAATGKADVCSMSVEPAILGYSKGLRLQIFFSRVHEYDYLLAVLDDSPIRTLADFRGKDIGEPNIGSSTEIPGDDMLQGAGVKRSEYNYIPVGVGGAALSALTSRKVAAVADSSVEIGQLSAVGGVKFRVFRDPILDSIPNVGFAARPDVIATKGDLLARFARAIVKASLLIRMNPTVAARYALQGENVTKTIDTAALKTEAAELVALQDDLAGADPNNPRIGAMDVRGIALYCRFFADSGRTPALVPAAALVTNQFIPFANNFDRKAWIAEVKKMRNP